MFIRYLLAALLISFTASPALAGGGDKPDRDEARAERDEAKDQARQERDEDRSDRHEARADDREGRHDGRGHGGHQGSER